MRYKILLAGFQHETNTFAPSKATYESFVRGEGFPQLAYGYDILKLRDVNIPAGGFILESEKLGFDIIPVVWAGASPSAHVEEQAYERIVSEITDAAINNDVDGIYLDLHGAMVAEHLDDGEGELISRLRAIVGNEIPIIASLDLHANVTELMLSNADALTAFRTYPHVDMSDTGVRAATLMSTRLREGKLHRYSRRLPFLIPINGMCTLLDPAKSFYADLENLESCQSFLSFAPGFPAADFEECGPVIWGYGTNLDEIAEGVEKLYSKLLREESLWEVPFLTPDEAVLQAISISATASRPVVIADTQDNPGAGGDANTTGLIKALLRNHAKNAAVGLICDPDAVRAALEAGLGAKISLQLGGQAGVPGDTPLEGIFEVVHLSDGQCHFDGPMMNGMFVDVGPVACLQIEGVLIGVSSSKAQMIDRNLFRMAGIVPELMSILVNKSSVHFRADFGPIAESILVAKAPGPMIADPSDLPWTRLQAGIRLKPNGRPFTL
ncbi:M81 family metallopeptidase [Pseudomonas putida]|uniref:M81 family metallopeptidase n=1 Tax=Pseudomonas putida TaxID=303 RepID=UPI0018AAC378|nr:M81 family metallopeptidase [Pseudomonas putida]MBF8668279.1 M81 family metallopeptidase [Pseudomonas putida]MBF8711779.1 M81 family metallopeptidase [Pseudomonas putida]